MENFKKFSGVNSFKRVPTLHTGNDEATNDLKKADMLADQYFSVSCSKNYPQAFLDSSSASISNSLDLELSKHFYSKPFNAPIHMSELKAAIRGRKNTAPGADSICYQMICNLPENRLSVVLQFFNYVWSTGTLPME